MAKESRSAVREYYNLSNRLKKYGNLITVLDTDTLDNQYTINTRGRYKIVLEFKSATLEGSIMSAPCVPYYQIADGFWSIYPYFLVFYCADTNMQGEYENYWYLVCPLNYSGVAYLNSVEAKLMSEKEFQEFITKLSPCQPTAHMYDYVPTIKKFIYYNLNKNNEKYVVNTGGENMYSTYEKVVELARTFGADGKYKKAEEAVLEAVEEEIYSATKEAWRKIRKYVIEKYYSKD